MIKIIMADDEKLILKSMQASVDWTGLGLELAACCEDGMEAYHAVLDENPDIVLTDIRMPGFDGLELIEKIRDVNPETEFIILSGYQEFEYARKALKYGVRYYLLKPVNREELEEALRSVISEIDRKRKVRGILERAMEQEAFGKTDPEDRAETGRHYRSFIQKTMDYCEAHLSEPDLSLKKISENVLFMNTDYVSREFFRETGEKFSAFLLRIRMKQAMLLMKNGQSEKKIYEIAEQVGCVNSQYFAQAFRKTTGMTPTGYCQKIKAEQEEKDAEGRKADGQKRGKNDTD